MGRLQQPEIAAPLDEPHQETLQSHFLAIFKIAFKLKGTSKYQLTEVEKYTN